MQMGRRKAGTGAFISDKKDFETKGYYIMTKGTIQQEDITLVNMYAPNTGAPKYVKHILMDIKEEINRNTVIVEDFNTLLTLMDRSSRQTINKKTMALNDTLDQMDLIAISSDHFNPKQQSIHSFQVNMVHFLEHTTLGHKTSLNKFKNIEMISSISSDHNAIKLEINHKIKTEKHTKTQKLNNMLLHNE